MFDAESKKKEAATFKPLNFMVKDEDRRAILKAVEKCRGVRSGDRGPSLAKICREWLASQE